MSKESFRVQNLQFKYETETAKQQYELLREQNELLEKRVRDRTVDLKAHRDRLAELNAQKAQMLANRRNMLRMATHDLNSPLTTIRLQSDVLVRQLDVLDKNQQIQKLGTIKSSVDQIIDLISRMLDSAQIELDDLAPVIKAVDVYKLCNNAVQLLEDSATSKDISIHNQVPTNLPTLHTDETFLRQIMINLISNAIKYSPSATVIKINVEARDGEMRFIVQDQGLGLTAEDKKHLFRKFQRLSARPTGGEDSTGLGLHITKNLVQALDGRIEADSTGRN